MVPLVYRVNHFFGKNTFLELFSKTSVLKSLRESGLSNYYKAEKKKQPSLISFSREGERESLFSEEKTFLHQNYAF
jgi:hypothetical protein